MGITTVRYLGHQEGHMISKLEENLGDTDIKNFTVSPLYQTKCITFYHVGHRKAVALKALLPKLMAETGRTAHYYKCYSNDRDCNESSIIGRQINAMP